jgi:rhodanese-related sulfurtransferase
MIMRGIMLMVSGVIFGLGLLACSRAQPTQDDYDAMLEGMYRKTVPLLRVEAVKEKGMHHFVILDTREPEEYAVSHLEGARPVGYESFDEAVVRDIPKDKPVLVYCSVGYRSERIGEKLQEMGFKEVYNLYGGIFDWKNTGNPVVDESGKPTDTVHTYNRRWSQWLFEGEKVY